MGFFASEHHPYPRNYFGGQKPPLWRYDHQLAPFLSPGVASASGSTPNGADSATAADVIGQIALATAIDSAAGIDVATNLLLAGIGDAVAGTDAGINILLAGAADFSSGTDLAANLSLMGVLESSSGVDANPNILLAGSGDAANGTEAVLSITLAAIGDSVVSSDAVGLAGNPSGTESTTGSDAIGGIALSVAQPVVGADLVVLITLLAFEVAGTSDAGTANPTGASGSVGSPTYATAGGRASVTGFAARDLAGSTARSKAT